MRTHFELCDLMIQSGTKSIKLAKDLIVCGHWRSIKSLNQGIRSYHKVGEGEMSSLLEFVGNFSGVSDVILHECDGWKWSDSEL